jgi:hypothetical protein
MTQEIIVAVLLVGIFGLICLLTSAMRRDEGSQSDRDQDSAVPKSSKAEGASQGSFPQRTMVI